MFLIIRVVLLSRSQHKAHKVLLAAGLADARRLMVIFCHGRAGRAIHIKIAQKQWQTLLSFQRQRYLAVRHLHPRAVGHTIESALTRVCFWKRTFSLAPVPVAIFAALITHGDKKPVDTPGGTDRIACRIPQNPGKDRAGKEFFVFCKHAKEALD